MSDHKKTPPKTPTQVQMISERSPPPAPYRPTIDRLVSDDTHDSSNKAEADSTALPSCFAAQQNQQGNRVDPMRHNYPAPKEPLDIEKALALTPRPYTFRHQLREMKEAGGNMASQELSEEDQKAEFVRVKRSLKSWGQNPKF
ncbi:hypothetical protein N431DRAFT_153548 [Stipitochalara longipes BDJ]|nr:hypothetical protein N431DRAFT_153548 [Stipitochalara longipes BDJ]